MARPPFNNESAHLAAKSWSMAETDEASNDMRTRLRSVELAETARLPVLRFLGSDRGGISCFERPLSSSGACLSVSVREADVSKLVSKGTGRRGEGGGHVEPLSRCSPCGWSIVEGGESAVGPRARKV